MTSPNVWGRHFWYTFHVSALGYPNNPSQVDAQIYKDFYTSFGKALPCKKCSDNYAKHLRQMPIDKYLSSPDSLFMWTVDMHNIVNKEHNKNEWGYDYAKSFYLSGSYNDCLNRNPGDKNDKQNLLILIIILNVIVILFAITKLLR